MSQQSFGQPFPDLNHIIIEANYADDILEEDILAGIEHSLVGERLLTSHLEQTKFIHHRNALLESSYRNLAHHNKELQERLNEYETLEKLHIEDRLIETLSAITNKPKKM